MDQPVREEYARRCERHRGLLDQLERRSRRLSFLRLVVALGVAAFVTVGLWELSAIRVWALVLAGGCAVVFVVVAVIHDRVFRLTERHRGFLKINEEAAFRLDRDWSRLPRKTFDEDSAENPAARDLDLFHREPERASLVRLLSSPGTAKGRECLRRWLLEPATPGTVSERQQAVRDLGARTELSSAQQNSRLDWRQELELAGRKLADKPQDPEVFLQWAEGASWLAQRRWMLWTARGLMLVTLVLLGLNIAGLLGFWWVGMLVVNLAFTALTSKKAWKVAGQVDWRLRVFGFYARLFGVAAGESFETEALGRLLERMGSGGLSAHRQLNRLDRLNGFAEIRRTMAYLPLQALLLWDFHVLDALERWKREAGPKVRQWLQALAELEALCALAGLHHDHPAWVFPDLEEGQAVLKAADIGHPLLHPGQCVTNDVTVGPPGSFLLVTGSNMSGKSTLLRAVGVNLALAQAGGPVCARTFTTTPLVTGTSFRIHDVLEDGVSYFMAELKRLKEVVELAAACDGQQLARPLLFLFDEILLGTNVFERQVAVRKVIRHLLSRGAIGAIATHDLSLADADEIADACRPVHFSESYQDSGDATKMVFDYKLKEGVAPTTNALKLLELVGLDEA
jgi:hypothetical protein